MSADDHVAVDIDLQKLKAQLVRFARSLAANQWYGSHTFEPDLDDKISEAVARAKSEIGEALLEALGVKKEDEEGR